MLPQLSTYLIVQMYVCDRDWFVYWPGGTIILIIMCGQLSDRKCNMRASPTPL